MTFISRKCPVCESSNSEMLYSQNFNSLPGLKKIRYGQKIVICKECGMSFVKEYLSEDLLGEYYTNMSNYEYPGDNFQWPSQDKKKSNRQFEFCRNHSKSNFSKVLDIGCSLGYTLSLFKNDGSSVIGIEPSENNKKLAKKMFGIEVISSFIKEDTNLPSNNNLIILSHVLEHIIDPVLIINKAKEALSENGLLFIEVPTIEEFDGRDLYQFSFEHINYFSHGSLKNLMHKLGFIELNHIIFQNLENTAPFYPTLGTLWFKGNIYSGGIINRYTHNKVVIQKYLELVNEHKMQIESNLKIFLNKNFRFGIWGAGSLTSQLLSNSSVSELNVKVIFDIDKKKNDLKMEDIIIKSPENYENLLKSYEIDYIIVGSWSNQDDIYTFLVNYVEPSKIIKLFHIA